MAAFLLAGIEGDGAARGGIPPRRPALTAREPRRAGSRLQQLLVDLEVARRGEQGQKLRVGVADVLGANEPVAAAAVPGPQQLLARMRPAARDEQLQLDRPQP